MYNFQLSIFLSSDHPPLVLTKFMAEASHSSAMPVVKYERVRAHAALSSGDLVSHAFPADITP